MFFKRNNQRAPTFLLWSLEEGLVGTVGVCAGPWQPLQHKWDEKGSAWSSLNQKLSLTVEGYFISHYKIVVVWDNHI